MVCVVSVVGVWHKVQTVSPECLACWLRSHLQRTGVWVWDYSSVFTLWINTLLLSVTWAVHFLTKLFSKLNRISEVGCLFKDTFKKRQAASMHCFQMLPRVWGQSHGSEMRSHSQGEDSLPRFQAFSRASLHLCLFGFNQLSYLWVNLLLCLCLNSKRRATRSSDSNLFVKHLSAVKESEPTEDIAVEINVVERNHTNQTWTIIPSTDNERENLDSCCIRHRPHATARDIDVRVCLPHSSKV